ncbi:MAG: class I SAM-dependent methyltransferase [Victivallaceae bacterium]
MDERLQHEIEHGKYLSEHGAGDIWNWTSPAGKLRWRRRVKMLTAQIVPEMKVLELGCGTGFFTREIAATGASVTAIDISPELLAEARRQVAAENVIFMQENGYAMSFADASFDWVIGSSVLHHLDMDKALKEIFRVLVPGGGICFTEPNMLNPQIALQKNIPWLKRKLGDSPDETAFFAWRLKKQLCEHGFEEISVTPFDFMHPALPGKLITLFHPLCNLAEKLPLISAIAGSLFIKCVKPE